MNYDSDGLKAYFDTDDDGTIDLYLLPTDNFDSSKYEYVTRYYINPDEDSSTSVSDYDTMGVIGVVTNSDDVPTSGTATYTGDAEGGYLTTGASSATAITGDMTASADFGNDTVNVTVSNITTSDGSDELFDTVSATDLALSDGARQGFYAGASSDITYSKDGSEVDITDFTGDNSERYASGSFYGLDSSDGNPAEIGGVITETGDDGEVAIIYTGTKD